MPHQLTGAPLGPIYAFAGYRLDLARVCLSTNGEGIKLRPKSFDVLRYLVERRGQVVTKDELFAHVWPDTAVTEDALVQCLVDIRRGLGEEGRNLIRTVPRRGYLFDAEVEIVEPSRVVAPPPPPAACDERVEAVRIVIDGEGPPSVEHVAGSSPFPLAPLALPLAPRFTRRRAAIIAAVVVAVAVAATAAYHLRPSAPAADSLAILPFRSIAVSESDNALELGITDTLITRLSLAHGLAVRPWASVQLYIGSRKDPIQAGRELRVQSVLDGSVQRSGDRIRVSARLYRVTDGKVLWAGTFDEAYRDAFAVQDAISETVAGALSLTLARPLRPAIGPEAFEAYARGRYFFELFTREGNQKAEAYFQRAIQLQPDFALAHAGFALNHGVMRHRGFVPPTEGLREEKEAAERAMQLDDSAAESHLALFNVYLHQRDWAGAARAAKRATELNPNYLHAWGFYAYVLHPLGRHEEALAASQRALEIDPVSDYASKDYAYSLLFFGRFEEAVARAQKAVELRPDFGPAHWVLASAYVGIGRLEDAHRHYVLAGAMVDAARIRAMQGDFGPARTLIEELRAKRYAGLSLAPLYTIVGDRERALDALESAYDDRIDALLFLGVDPRFEPLHSSPRFAALLQRLHLPLSSSTR